MGEQGSDPSCGDEHSHFDTLEGLRHLAEAQEEGRIKLGGHVTRISRMLVMVSEAFERLEVAVQEANRARDAAAAVRRVEYDERLAGLASDAVAARTRIEERFGALTMEAATSRTRVDDQMTALKSQLDVVHSDAAAARTRIEEHLGALATDAAASRARVDDQVTALKSQLDVIHQNQSRLIDLREQADVHHTGLFGFLLNGQNQLRTEIAEIKHWVVSRALRPAGPGRFDALPPSLEVPRAVSGQVERPDAG